MPCEHNAAKIEKLKEEVKQKQTELNSLTNNRDICKTIKDRHENFADKVSCVDKNLADIRVVEGKTYDEGKMKECYEYACRTADDCTKLIERSNIKIGALQSEIRTLSSMIMSLNGNCDICYKAKNV